MAHDLLFKFIVVGNSGVGKSCVVLQLCNKEFSPVHDYTIGVEFASKIVPINQHFVKLQIWDTAGQEAFSAITKCYYRGSCGVILVYDISNRKTFEKVPTWLEGIREQCPASTSILLLGNKSDLAHRRQVTMEEGYRFAQAHGMLFREVTARSYQDIESAVTQLAHHIYQKIMNKEISPCDENGIRPSANWDTDPGAGTGNVRSGTQAVRLVSPDASRASPCCGIVPLSQSSTGGSCN